MSKKIVAIFLLMTILFSNCAIAVEGSLKYVREGGNNLYEVASEYKDKIYINNIEDYATSIRVDYTKVKIYDYNSKTEKKCTGETEVKYSQNKDKYYLTSSVFRDGKKAGQKIFGDGDQYLFYTIKLDSGAVNEKNIATFIYEDAIQFKGQTYDVKLNLKEINKVGAAQTRAKVLIACRNESDNNKFDIKTYNQKFEPAVGMDKGDDYNKDYKAEISVEYFIVDKNGNEVKFNGMLEVSDLDQYQGLVINNFKANKDNAFIEKAFDTVKYRYIDSNNFFVYTTVPGNLDDAKDTYYDYFLLNNRNSVDMVFTFDTVPAHSSILFNTDMMTTYKEIVTEVVGGKITPSINYIKLGEEKTVSYSPNNAERQYIKSITVDGKAVEPGKTNKGEYVFSNIQDNHKITVVYADKYKVEYDAKGGSPTPDTEFVEPNNKATKPSDPTRPGYTFEGWVKPGEDKVYDFNTPVTSDILLEAKWTPNAPKSGIPYKVEHYKQTKNGDYKLALTENATGEENATVTAKAKVFEGYKENTTHPERKAEGIVLANGSLVLKLYYDLQQYKVEYDAKGGSPTPATEYVNYNDVATEPADPTRPGYTFEGWVKTGDTDKYDFNTPVTSDIKLEANWKPIVYHIYYVLNGGTNDPSNPDTYTAESNITFKPATREGYDFLGWFEDENFTKPIDSISNRTGDITIYAKWRAKNGVAYKVEHYKQEKTGEYKLVITDELTGVVDSKVTATPKLFVGYKENTTHPERKAEGTVLADGSLVLKLYYDKIQYTVTFDPQNGTTIDDQTVDYQDKATEPEKPVKEGYEFEYWYYIDENGKEVEYNFNDPVTHDIDLIAKWKELPKKEDKTPDNSKTEKVIPYTGKTMLFTELAVTVLAGIVITNIVRVRKSKKGFFRSL